MTRDARGRFCTEDQATAERVLERAVREARATLRRGIWRKHGRSYVEADHRYLAEKTMRDAAGVAEMLLGRSS